MKKFVLVYYGQPNFQSAEEAKEHQELWKKWAAELGEAIVEPGNPAKPGKKLTASSVSDTDANDFSGYTIVQAGTLDEAVEYTKNCPFVIDGGTMSVHEVMQMEM